MYHAAGLGEKGQIDSTQTGELSRTCDRCQASLIAHAVGKASVRYDNRAAAQARFQAEIDARQDMRLIALLAPCPSCGARDRSAVRALLRHAGLCLVAVAALIAVAVKVDLPPLQVMALLAAWGFFISALTVNLGRLRGSKRRVEISLREHVPVAALPIQEASTR
jgi:hypothetical protein